eukprot:XP_001693116.1 predicted protein [Chlamydomonas reinhardtii]
MPAAPPAYMARKDYVYARVVPLGSLVRQTASALCATACNNKEVAALWQEKG